MEIVETSNGEIVYAALIDDEILEKALHTTTDNDVQNWAKINLGETHIQKCRRYLGNVKGKKEEVEEFFNKNTNELMGRDLWGSLLTEFMTEEAAM